MYGYIIKEYLIVAHWFRNLAHLKPECWLTLTGLVAQYGPDYSNSPAQSERSQRLEAGKGKINVDILKDINWVSIAMYSGVTGTIVAIAQFSSIED
jgi:hypothetical protein